MAILVLGGARLYRLPCSGRLVNKGYEVVVVDSLFTGHKAAVLKKQNFMKGHSRQRIF